MTAPPSSPGRGPALGDRLHDADDPHDAAQRPGQPHERKPGEGSADAAERRHHQPPRRRRREHGELQPRPDRPAPTDRMSQRGGRLRAGHAAAVGRLDQPRGDHHGATADRHRHRGARIAAPGARTARRRRRRGHPARPAPAPSPGARPPSPAATWSAPRSPAPASWPSASTTSTPPAARNATRPSAGGSRAHTTTVRTKLTSSAGASVTTLSTVIGNLIITTLLHLSALVRIS